MRPPHYEGLQGAALDGAVYYAEITDEGVRYYQLDGTKLVPCEAPALTAEDGGQLLPVEKDGAVWFPELSAEGELFWNRWVNGQQEIYSGDPRQDVS